MVQYLIIADSYIAISQTFKGLGNQDHIEDSPYVQDILAYWLTLSSHENELLRLLLSELWGLLYAQSA